MPTEQNNDLSENSAKRVLRLKLFLIFGPYVFAFISIILCVVLAFNISSVSDEIEKNTEMLNGVIQQQGDLSEEVYNLSSRQEAIDTHIASLSDSVAILQGQVVSVHPGIAVTRDPNANPKRVYLTFDDGPSPNTGKILDILKQYGVKATFFTVGKETETGRELYNRIISEGHTLGMHSYSHVYSEIYAGRDSFEADLSRISSVIENATGYSPVYYRFPGGSNNKIIGDKFEEFSTVLQERGITYFDWNVSTGDATNPALSADEIVENAFADIDKYEDVIILMHDLGNKGTTVEALPIIIERLQSEGIPIEPISESTTLIQYH